MFLQILCRINWKTECKDSLNSGETCLPQINVKVVKVLGKRFPEIVESMTTLCKKNVSKITKELEDDLAAGVPLSRRACWEL